MLLNEHFLYTIFSWVISKQKRGFLPFFLLGYKTIVFHQKISGGTEAKRGLALQVYHFGTHDNGVAQCLRCGCPCPIVFSHLFVPPSFDTIIIP